MTKQRSSAHTKSKMYFSYGMPDELGDVSFYGMHGVYADILIRTSDGWRIQSRANGISRRSLGHSQVFRVQNGSARIGRKT